MTIPGPNEFPEIRSLWEVYCSIRSQKGFDIPKILRSWVGLKRDSLAHWGTQQFFDELCESGCNDLAISIVIALLDRLQRGAEIWRATTGKKRDREQTVRALLKAAEALEALNEGFVTALLRDMNASLDPDLRAILSLDTVTSKSLGLSGQWPINAPAAHPADVVKALRLYVRVLRMFDDLSQQTHMHSSSSLPKYLLSAYVKRVTGSFHDKEVSALIGSALKTTYDEVTHSMWRSRNYDQLDETSSGLAELLVGIGAVCLPKT